MAFSQSELAQAAEIWVRTQNYDEVAREMGIKHAAAYRRCKAATQIGLLDLNPAAAPGFEITKHTAVIDESGEPVREFIQQKPTRDKRWALPEGMGMVRNSAYVDAEGKIIGEWKIAVVDKDAALMQLMEYLKGTFNEVQTPHIPVTPPTLYDNGKLNLIPCNDWHLNMLAWERECPENWDLKIAEPAIGDAMCSAINRAGPAGTAVILGGGDLLHSDNDDNRTRRSGAVLDCDTRHTKGREAATRIMRRVVDEALLHNETVLLRLLKGNHDEYSTAFIAGYLSAWYRNDPRVIVDLDENLFWAYQFGDTMLTATHGHTVKMQQIPEIMAGYWPQMWGATRYHFGHFFHIHHRDKLMSEHGHCIVESHRAPIPKDGWHHASGYLSGRDVQVITYSKNRGETGRVYEIVGDPD